MSTLTRKASDHEIFYKQDGGATNPEALRQREMKTPAETAKTYDDWVENGTYESDTAAMAYSGPQMTADAAALIFSKNRASVRVIDMAAGTGLLAKRNGGWDSSGWKPEDPEETHVIADREHGFKHIDGVDPSPISRKNAMNSNLYGRYIIDFVDERRLDIKTDEYDCVVSSGGFAPGLMPSIALKEFIRVVKPGGYAFFSCTEYILTMSNEHRDKFEPLMEQYVAQGVWERISRTVVQNYFDQKPGVIYVFRILKSEVQD